MQHDSDMHICRSSKHPVKLDQHFMVDIDVLKLIVKAADIKKSDKILEIGAGTGNLTKVLSLTGARVTAIEIDPEMAAVLKERFSNSKNVQVIEGNALKLLKKTKFNKIVANIPYAICEPLLLLLREVDFEFAVMTVPKNFANNIASETKLGIETGIFFKVSELFEVPRHAFAPEPGTDSVVISIKPAKDSILKAVLLQSNAKVKNAIMEALVSREKCTKNQAREAIKALNLSNVVSEKPVKDMHLNDLLQLVTKSKDIS